jgi:DNA repair exonuclease SbcCD ATPase subunit
VITFEKLSVRNLLSWGDQFTEISLVDHHLSLLYGKSGSGKSSLICDSLFFGLFGKAYKNVNKPTLCNSVNGGDCVVEVSFHTPEHSYVIVRGIKPNVFKIFEDNVLIEQTAEVKDYQQHLEKNILKMNDKIFRQIVFVGSSNYVPFLKLPLALRRDIIENILNIKVYSTMLTKLKDKISFTENQIRVINNHMSQLKTQIEMQQSFHESIERDTTKEIEGLEEQILKCHERQAILEKGQAQLHKKLQKLLGSDSKTDWTHIAEKHKKNIYTFKDHKKKLETDIEFFATHANMPCPSCEQLITGAFKETIRHNKQQEILNLEQSLVDEQKNLQELTVKLMQCQELETVQLDIERKLREQHKTIERLQQTIIKVQQQKHEKTIVDSSLQDKYEQHLSQKMECLKMMDCYEQLMPLLKDSGVKTIVIKQYIIRMNEMLNSFLDALSLPIHFNINEEFKEEIKSRYRDNFCYENFSDGERARIDLGLALLLREMSKLKNSVSCNLLVLDEADSALDPDSRKAFFNLYNKLLNDQNIFIISHHQSEEQMEKYENILHIEKVGNFSVLQQEG